MLAISGADTSPDNLVYRMCLEEDTWNAIDRAIAQIMSALQRKWREDPRVAIIGQGRTSTAGELSAGVGLIRRRGLAE